MRTYALALSGCRFDSYHRRVAGDNARVTPSKQVRLLRGRVPGVTHVLRGDEKPRPKLSEVLTIQSVFGIVDKGKKQNITPIGDIFNGTI